MFHVLLPAAHVLYHLGIGIPGSLMSLTTPPFSGMGGNSFQSAGGGSGCPPDCSGEGGVWLPEEVVTIYAHYTKFEMEMWKWQQRIGAVDTYLSGIVDEINPLAKYARHAGDRISERIVGFNNDPVDENSRLYLGRPTAYQSERTSGGGRKYRS